MQEIKRINKLFRGKKKSPITELNLQGKDNHFIAQLKIVFQYLQENTATASMVSAATGIEHKNICRHKRVLEKAGLLWEVENKQCEKTGFKAWYLTTNPDYAPDSPQLRLFEGS